MALARRPYYERWHACYGHALAWYSWLARALAQQPQILLLDEPTAHLDLRYQTELLALIRHLAQHDGIAVVVTLHDLNHAALCATRIALLAHGTLVAMGHPEAVLTPDCLSQVYGVTV